MSRAINFDLTQQEVRAAVTKNGGIITVIEPLFPRGTRVVLAKADDAAKLGRTLKSKVLHGAVVRTPLRTRG